MNRDPRHFRDFFGLTAALWCCPFRPFFLLTALSGVLALALWLLILGGLMPAPPVQGGALLWHAHELIFGFAVASIAGFLLTAAPEFTHTKPWPAPRIQGLVILWLSGRLSYAFSEIISLWPAMLCDSLLLLGLLIAVARPIWQQPERRHLAFVYSLLMLIGINLGYYLALARAADAMPWLRLAVGALMILIVVALSRISMRLVNDVLAQQGGLSAPYLARPPRRNLAISCIAIASLAEFWQPASAVSGWLSLAAAAAICNLLNDWHVGRALTQRWALIPYSVYMFMALGFGLIGFGHLAGHPYASAGTHLLTIGSLGGSVLIVMAVAGRMHSGWGLDHRRWLPLCAFVICIAALARAASGNPDWSAGARHGWMLSGLLWIVAWGIYLVYSFKPLAGPRPDNLHGCDEAAPISTPDH